SVGYLRSFFFQAEDGIRDFHVTGVQTCALPISAPQWPLLVPRQGVPASGGDDDLHVGLLKVEREEHLADGPLGEHGLRFREGEEIGRASCRERAWRSGVGAA